MAKATKKQARQWCLGLIARQGASMSVDDVEAQLALSLPTLIGRFPAEAFCAASLDDIAGKVRYWNEAAVTTALDAWWQANDPRPSATLPPEAESAAVSREAKHWLAMWYRCPDDAQAERALDLMRSQSTEAFTYLTRVDTRAADVAVWKKWHIPGQRYDWTEDDVRAAAHKVVALRGHDGRFAIAIAVICLSTLVQAVKANAPEHGDALLEELRWIAAGKPSEPVPVAFPSAPLFGD